MVFILQKEACKKRDRELITKEVSLIKKDHGWLQKGGYTGMYKSS